MEYSTSELCDMYIDQVDVVESTLSSFGGCSNFCGPITTLKCFESNGVLKDLSRENGRGRILVIDGGGSLRRALIDIDIAIQAAENNWSGLICYGAVRDVDELHELDIGIQALGSIPIGASPTQYGEIDIPIHFCGTAFLPGDHLYADTTGIILCAESLDVSIGQ